MMFHTTAFILGFLPVCLVGFFTLGRFCSAVWALAWLVTCSLFFYAWWNPEHLPLLIGSVAFNYILAWKLKHTHRVRAWLTTGVALNLAILGWFKYADFLLHIVSPDAPGLNISLPLAISFFTFQQVMFLVDTSRGAAKPRSTDAPAGHSPSGAALPTVSLPRLELPALPQSGSIGPTLAMPELAQEWGQDTIHGHAPLSHPRYAGVDWVKPLRGKTLSRCLTRPDEQQGPDKQRNLDMHPGNRLPSPLFYVAFVTFFPHLIAGPIVRPSNIIPQFAAPDAARPRSENVTDGLLIFLLGLGKKLVLADMFGGFSDTGFDAAAHGAALTFFEAWYATLSYGLQIYFDFSGYSDMATGLARMLNISFPLNFDSPYQATNIADFWRRWHITLGGFLRDYLYVPLGGNRRGPLRQAGNLMATMLLCGLWHGAAWNFVIWGGLHGLLIVVHKQYRRLFRPMPTALSHPLTLFVVVLAWVPFRATSFGCTWAMLHGMAGLNGIALPRMIVSALPPLAVVADPVTVLPFLGDGRTLSFPEVSSCLGLGWFIVLVLPNIYRMSQSARHWALTGSFALSVQALFFAPHVAPFLYFQF